MALAQSEVQVAPSTTPHPSQQRGESVGLDISIRTGTGTGRTLLSAFDHALQGAGVGDFNLVTLSSVIPTASRIRHVDGLLPGGHGDLLFSVRAEAFADRPGDSAWAGLGWVTDETGGGLFVEHHGHSEASVIEQIEHSLGDMNAKRGGRYGEVQMTLASAECTEQPVCALVLAAFRVSSWHEGSEPASPPPPHEDELVATPPAASPAAASGPGGTHSQVVDDWVAAEHEDEPDLVGAPVGQTANGTPDQGPVVRVSVEKEVDYATAKVFYELYRQTFGELDHEAAGRQLLTRDEFLAEMLDPRVHKYIAWDEHGLAIGMSTLTTDLETLPWVSPTYFAHHYPDHYARQAIYYLGFTLVHPEHRGAGVFQAMIEQTIRRVIENRGVAAWDTCQVNDERGISATAGRLFQELAGESLEVIDRQVYYAVTVHGPREKPNTAENQP